MSADWSVLLFILLPIAAMSGWWAARRYYLGRARENTRRLTPDYYRGLNYVLNEQPDKAIEIFVRMIEVDSETVETHLALAKLFRRRGEVDRAIRIHQNLIARPALAPEYRSQALLELGIDYLRLGILDRAEGLFNELVAADTLTEQALNRLLDIYQQEKEWLKAITAARRLESIGGAARGPLLAQFHCELALQEMEGDQLRQARTHIKRALNLDPRCVRASLLEGRLQREAGNHRAAIAAYLRVEKQDPEYLGEITEPLGECYRSLNRDDHYEAALRDMVMMHGGVRPLITLTDIIASRHGDEQAIACLSEALERKPTLPGLQHLMNYIVARIDSDEGRLLAQVRDLTGRLLRSHAAYRCNQCGFEARQLYWYCPGCKTWNNIKPVTGVIYD